MNLFCAIGGHEPNETQVYNGGYHFTRCRRCRCDLIRSPKCDWQEVPAGHRVAWKAGRHSHSIEPDYEGALPVLREEAHLPAVRTSFLSWNRDLIHRAGPGISAMRLDAEATAEADDHRPPRLILIAVLIGAGLQLLLGLGRGKLA